MSRTAELSISFRSGIVGFSWVLPCLCVYTYLSIYLSIYLYIHTSIYLVRFYDILCAKPHYCELTALAELRWLQVRTAAKQQDQTVFFLVMLGYITC